MTAFPRLGPKVKLSSRSGLGASHAERPLTFLSCKPLWVTSLMQLHSVGWKVVTNNRTAFALIYKLQRNSSQFCSFCVALQEVTFTSVCPFYQLEWDFISTNFIYCAQQKASGLQLFKPLLLLFFNLCWDCKLILHLPTTTCISQWVSSGLGKEMQSHPQFQKFICRHRKEVKEFLSI